MPVEPHPDLPVSGDETVIWRYMDFARFVQLISTKSLWFARSDTFEDPLEGTHTDAELADIKHDEAVFEAFRADPSKGPLTTKDLSPAAICGGLSAYSSMLRITAFVNCWRLGEQESFAMWDLYGKGSGIVAVKSTIGLLRTQLNQQDQRIFLADVRYIDWSTSNWTNNVLHLCSRKDMSYAHESELRAVLWPESLFSNVHAAMRQGQPLPEIPVGLRVRINPADLITEVVIGPREKDWVANVVGNVMSIFGCTTRLTQSNRLRPR